jgi:hypothetical protein
LQLSPFLSSLTTSPKIMTDIATRYLSLYSRAINHGITWQDDKNNEEKVPQLWAAPLVAVVGKSKVLRRNDSYDSSSTFYEESA